MPESVATLAMLAELMIEGAATDTLAAAKAASGVEIVGGDVVIRPEARTYEELLRRTIQAARAATT